MEMICERKPHQGEERVVWEKVVREREGEGVREVTHTITSPLRQMMFHVVEHHPLEEDVP
jgi:hypothetical protein